MALALALFACSRKAQSTVEAAKTHGPRDAAAATAYPADWRILAPFVPEQLGEFERRDELTGSLTTVVDMPVSKVVRKYEAGVKTLFVTITDAIGAPVMREPFARALTLDREGPNGYQKGKRIGDHPAMAVWEAHIHRSEVTMLVADRYVVKVDVRQAATDDEAEKLLMMLDIDALAKLARSSK
jgi:hypothetical protein